MTKKAKGKASGIAYTPEQLAQRKKSLYSLGNDFWVCPNTGRILLADHHDDKVMCGCGKQNPHMPPHPHGGSWEHGNPICHIKKYLKSSTVDDYLAQRKDEGA